MQGSIIEDSHENTKLTEVWMGYCSTPENQTTRYTSHAYTTDGKTLAYAFTAKTNAIYSVTIYFSETWSASAKPKGRAFKVSINGKVIKREIYIWMRGRPPHAILG